MRIMSVRRPRTALGIIAGFLVGFILLHQLSYLSDAVFTRSLSDSIDVLQTCPRSNLHSPNNFGSHIGFVIPNVIHQIWKTSDVRTYSIAASRSSWQDIAEPMNYTVKLWPEEDIIKLITRNYPWMLATYRGYTQNIQRADIARLVVLHAEGGIYADLDVYPQLLDEVSCLQKLGYEAIFTPMAGTSGISNHLIMAERGSKALEWILHEAKRRENVAKRMLLPYLQVFWSTGPIMVTSALLQYARANGAAGHTVAVLDDNYAGMVVRHATGRSWHGPDGRLLNYLADHDKADWLWPGAYLLVAVLCIVCMIITMKRHAVLYTRLATFIRLKAP